MAKSHLQLVTPTEILRTVPPKRGKNADLRTREHLTVGEVEALIEAARGNRYGHRDATMILLAFRHGLRASEVCDLRWDKSTSPAPCCTSAGSRTAPRHAPHPRRRAKGAAPAPPGEPAVTVHFCQRAGIPVHHGRLRPHDRAAAAAAGLELKAHPHMLRHACGYALANKGHDTRAIQGWLGHRSITSTAVYTALAPNRFKDFWRD